MTTNVPQRPLLCYSLGNYPFCYHKGNITDLGKVSRDLSSSASICIITPSQATILKGNKAESSEGNERVLENKVLRGDEEH